MIATDTYTPRRLDIIDVVSVSGDRPIATAVVERVDGDGDGGWVAWSFNGVGYDSRDWSPRLIGRLADEPNTSRL